MLYAYLASDKRSLSPAHPSWMSNLLKLDYKKKKVTVVKVSTDRNVTDMISRCLGASARSNLGKEVRITNHLASTS